MLREGAVKLDVYTCERCGREEPFTPKPDRLVPRKDNGVERVFYIHTCVALDRSGVVYARNKVTS